MSKPISLCTWNLCILLYVNCISMGRLSNVSKLLRATQSMRNRADNRALVVCLPGRPIGLHHPPSRLFPLSWCTFQNHVRLVIGPRWLSEAAWQRMWEVSMGSTIKSGTLNHQLRTTLETAVTHANFKQDKIMIMSPPRKRWVEEWVSWEILDVSSNARSNRKEWRCLPVPYFSDHKTHLGFRGGK